VRRALVFFAGAMLSAESLAYANPAETARDKYREAAQLAADDDNDKALELVDAGLALAPKDLPLLELRGSLLLKTRDFAGALAAYQAYVDAGATGANRRAAQKIVASLTAVKTTSVAVNVANGPGTVYLDAKSQGVFCTGDAAGGCNKVILPGSYRVIVERAGFVRWSQQVEVAPNKTTEVAVTLVEKPSPFTVRVSVDGSKLALDGNDIAAPPPQIPGGDHELTVTHPGYATAKLPVHAHVGEPVAVNAELVPLVPFVVTPAGATVTVDGAPAVLEAGGVAVPPGAHNLVARAPKFHDKAVAIPAERAAEYKVDVALDPVGAMLDVAGAPAGAQIVVDGKRLATTPLTAPVEVPAGTHSIEVLADGYRPVHEHGSFASEAHARLEVGKLRPDNRRRTYLALGGSVVALGIGGWASGEALSRQNEYNTQAHQPGVTQSDPTLRALASSGRGFAIGADIGLGLGIVGIAATTYFFLHEGRGWSDGALRVEVGPGMAMVSGRF
jgi:hypothetical protein